MKRRKPGKYAQKMLARIKESTRAAKSGEEEQIHRLRLALKKFHAFLRLVRPAKRKVNFPGILKTLYRAAGEVRDLQVHSCEVAVFLPSGCYPDRIRRRLEKAQE